MNYKIIKDENGLYTIINSEGEFVTSYETEDEAQAGVNFLQGNDEIAENE